MPIEPHMEDFSNMPQALLASLAKLSVRGYFFTFLRFLPLGQETVLVIPLSRT